MKNSLSFLISLLLGFGSASAAQQANPPKSQVERTAPAREATPPRTEQPPQEAIQNPPEHPQERAQTPAATTPGEEGRTPAQEQHFDMTEVAPSVTHHQIQVNGKLLRYTATAGRLPIKDATNKTEALMFYVAYTLEGADAGQRPLTFAFNGGPGSASIWLHMGALGPRKVVLRKEGFMPAAPYRLEDNTSTLLDKSDLVLVDAIGTGFSRPSSTTTLKKFWGMKGDIEAFGEFIRLYITRNERWSSPLYLLGESYGTTRAAGVSGYLADKGISFNGIILLSTVLAFETLEFNKTNDLAYPLILPTYTMIAAYHHKLPQDLAQNMEKTRAEVEKWASNEYTRALAKGDAMTQEERQAAIDGLARYTGLSKEIIDQYNLRIDVQCFTHYLLADQKLRVGRLDGRFSGPDPEGFAETRFYDPTSSETGPPFTSVFNEYVRRELNYKTDMPYYTTAYQTWGPAMKWDWGSAGEGFPDTASALRAAVVKNSYLKVRVLEGYYDLATPYYAANYTMDHLDLSPRYRNNISYATFDSGHMVYLDLDSLRKMKENVASFIDQSTSGTQ
ncbi:MAG: peptidase S10 [Acidobacteriaceae bacterium]|nr:peptidase S10 [Acidobacteriaceae bacterium]MBV9296708.1 peptidase S10 [Acidobacteriaceae bacterium]